jgi:hypothetical protein
MSAINEKIFSIIIKALSDIQEKRDWSFFDEFVVCNKSHEGQSEFLSHSVHRENGLHPGNGWGKTSVLAKKHIYYILKHYADGSKYKTLNAAITQEQSELIQEEIISLIYNSPLLRSWLLPKNGIVKFPQPRLRYSNGASTEFKTTKKKGESIEGKEYGYISVDEIALEQHLEFLREKIVLPRLRRWKDSQADFAATPKGYTAWYRVCETIKRGGGYVRGGSSFENPYIDHELLNYQIQTWSEEKVKQIVHGQFIDTSSMMFASRVPVLFKESLKFEDVKPGHRYVEGWDLARGKKLNADLTVGYRLDVTSAPYRIVKYWAFQLPWTEKERENINNSSGSNVEKSSIEREIRQANSESDSDVYLDSTGLGDTLYGMLQDIAKPVDFRGGGKDRLLDHCQALIDTESIKSPFIPELADQMTLYQRQDTNLETDYLMGLVVACSSLPVVTKRVVEFSDYSCIYPELTRSFS